MTRKSSRSIILPAGSYEYLPRDKSNGRRGDGGGGGGERRRAYKKMHLLQGKSAELSHHFHVFLQIFAFDKSGCLLLPVEGERFQGKL